MSLDPARCPICGQANRCAMEVERETGVQQGACWCTGVDFGADLLAQVPPAAQRQACICAACAAKQLSPPAGPPAAP
ncbi:cysteine-rich CWC family protein [Ramlibacter sp.]|uniref:cysteine-rich CWC family protein n=1 Tax=Ramlibacter sp. TaxID=1917967 RepID=UPI002D082262|nr:cysteine-rich CWC family protein [Ramlibacter sp.]HWI82904.1 cysteine-rich CWC family protein [Ramlibacter sp.]